MTKEFKQRVTLPCNAKLVFEQLLDSRKHTKITKSPAFVNKREGGTFTAFNGQLTGRNIEIKPNKKIVQAIRFKNWDKDCYSIVTLKTIQTSNNKCTLELLQVGIPSNNIGKVKKHWNNNYWQMFKDFLLGEKPATKKVTKKAVKRKRTAANLRVVLLFVCLFEGLLAAVLFLLTAFLVTFFVAGFSPSRKSLNICQ
jgi:hypothetical protein